SYVKRARLARVSVREGRVAEVVGMLVEVEGIAAAVGSQLEAEAPHGSPRLPAGDPRASPPEGASGRGRPLPWRPGAPLSSGGSSTRSAAPSTVNPSR